MWTVSRLTCILVDQWMASYKTPPKSITLDSDDNRLSDQLATIWVESVGAMLRVLQLTPSAPSHCTLCAPCSRRPLGS